ncbi:Kef-type K+ transport system membrane component KefB [Streptosporangium becharense]|uniref:Kef-type K+ transport system membrane component KefB n=1 Tax=Streptosporangium becharense TaxID=1816182 RepID=A0A7W9MEJ0_9ACTN|nr:cation:proton antiporter [Streptosporangium becharense]MBB2913759.1 Kef-type K+ transport system membrane component KefB [Streptosporangium becharense]MBB5817840.1 Kef-type K+ transport system membrane component KefB [Streptosporangium becharense]
MDLLLLDLVIVLAAARLFGAAAKWLGQPPVIGEIVAGILLGPTLLGPLIGDTLFGPEMLPPLQALANVGLVLFMFVVGLELDQKLVRGKGRIAVTVALGSTVLPFVLGCLLALSIAGEHVGGDKTLPFVLFMGAAMSATAFPVLARILTDRGMQRIALGGLSLAAAAVIDVLAWTVLAVVVGIAGAGEAEGQWKVLLALPYALVMFLVVKPLLARLVPAYEKAGRLTPGLLSLVLIGLIASAWATEWMHVHYIFGAFVFGTVMPREGAERLTHEILERLEQLAVLLLLPMFFVVAGLNVNLRTLDLSSLGTLAGILAVAIGGKMLGSYAAARAQRLPNRQSWAMAALLNTRGLTEIVILSVGLQKGVLSNELYSLMVVMALVTTGMTGPLLRRIYPDRRVARDIADAERAALGVTAAHRVLVIVPEPCAEQGPLIGLAAALATAKTPSEVVLGHLRPYPEGRLEVGNGLSSELAELAETLHDLEELAGAARERGTDARVVSRFSADVAGELPELISGAQPDLLVLPAATPGHTALLGAATCRVVTVAAAVPAEHDSVPAPVAVHYGTGGDIAVHVALILAALDGRPLVVTGGGRAPALAQRLAKLGVTATSGPVPEGALVVAADTGQAVEGAHLLVRAEQDADPVDWAAAVSALRSPVSQA